MKIEQSKGQRSAAENAGQTLFEFVRHWSRRSGAPLNHMMKQNGRHVLVIEAIGALTKRGSATINAVADEIGIDQSGASRLVKEATLAGYLEMKPSPLDARQRQVVLSKAGKALLIEAYSWQEKIFQQLTLGWKDEERKAFHRAMLGLLNRSREIGL